MVPTQQGIKKSPHTHAPQDSGMVFCTYHIHSRFPFGRWVDLKSLGCHKLKRVNTGVPIYQGIYIIYV